MDCDGLNERCYKYIKSATRPEDSCFERDDDREEQPTAVAGEANVQIGGQKSKLRERMVECRSMCGAGEGGLEEQVITAWPKRAEKQRLEWMA